MQDRKGSWRIACATLIVGVCFAGAASAQQFQLFAGGDGDGGPALQANLAGASDAVYDKAGNLYVSQKTANRIRKITPGGTITTVVGGSAGFAGDGGPASAAKIDQPEGLALDAAGNLYFADWGNRRVRRISTTGIITTVAGNGAKAHSGDGGAATLASFITVDGLAIDASGNLFVSDANGSRVRKITPGGVITTVAGTGTGGNSGDNGPAVNAQLNFPLGIDVDAAGNLYIADFSNDRIRKVSPSGTITTFAVVGSGFLTFSEERGGQPDGRGLFGRHPELRSASLGQHHGDHVHAHRRRRCLQRHARGSGFQQHTDRSNRWHRVRSAGPRRVRR